MGKFRFFLPLNFVIGIMVLGCGSESGKNSGMDMSGNKFETIDVTKFGKGKDAKICPVSGEEIKPMEKTEALLSNGKRIMMCCPDCKKSIEKNLKKYESLMY